MYDKQKSFGERERYQDIEFQYFETDDSIECDFRLKFKKDSFRNNSAVYEFCMDIAEQSKTYFKTEDFNISQIGEWIDIDLDLSYSKQSPSSVPEGLYKINDFLKKINPLVKQTEGNSLDNLIYEFSKENPALLFDDEIENDIAQNKHNQFSFIAGENPYTKVDPYIEATLRWATIRADQSDLIEYIINDDLGSDIRA